jgi:hypothetical protein
MKRSRFPHLVHISEKLHLPTHAAYFGLVALEAHGTYGIAAAVLLVLTLISMLFGGD